MGGDRRWQIGQTRFRHTLAGSTVTIFEYLDGEVSIRFGPHVVGRFTAEVASIGKDEGRGKGAASTAVSYSQNEEGGSRS
jgi:hypothetical protein